MHNIEINYSSYDNPFECNNLYIQMDYSNCTIEDIFNECDSTYLIKKELINFIIVKDSSNNVVDEFSW